MQASTEPTTGLAALIRSPVRPARADASDAGASAEGVLERVGPPRLLAAALMAQSVDQHGDSAPANAWRVIAGSMLITGTSFTSLVVVPLLAVMAVGFGLTAVLSPIAGVLRTVGAGWIQINLGPGWSLPDEWSIPFMLGMPLFARRSPTGAAPVPPRRGALLPCSLHARHARRYASLTERSESHGPDRWHVADWIFKRRDARSGAHAAAWYIGKTG